MLIWLLFLYLLGGTKLRLTFLQSASGCGQGRYAVVCCCADAAHLCTFSSGKLWRPHWSCCHCWVSPTCCSLWTPGRTRSPALSSSTSTLSWNPSRYESWQLHHPVGQTHDIHTAYQPLSGHARVPRDVSHVWKMGPELYWSHEPWAVCQWYTASSHPSPLESLLNSMGNIWNCKVKNNSGLARCKSTLLSPCPGTSSNPEPPRLEPIHCPTPKAGAMPSAHLGRMPCQGFPSKLVIIVVLVFPPPRASLSLSFTASWTVRWVSSWGSVSFTSAGSRQSSPSASQFVWQAKKYNNR